MAFLRSGHLCVFPFRNGPIKGQRANLMYDTLMVLLGFAMFGMFLGYSELCVKL